MKKLLFLSLLLFNIVAYGQIIEDENGMFFDSEKNPFSGNYTEYFKDGNVRIELQIKNGLKHGKVFIYNTIGDTLEIHSFYKGMKHGTWETRIPPAQKIGIANYKNDLKNGIWIIWDENGVKRYEMHYLAGKKSGTWYMWSEDGKLISKKNF